MFLYVAAGHLTRSDIVHTDCYFYKATITRDKVIFSL